MGFFVLLAITPFPLGMGAAAIGWIFFGWGLARRLHVWVAPALQRRLGSVPVVAGALTLFALDLLVMSLSTAHPRCSWCAWSSPAPSSASTTR